MYKGSFYSNPKMSSYTNKAPLSSRKTIHNDLMQGSTDAVTKQMIEMHAHRLKLGELWLNGEVDYESIEFISMRLLNLIQSERFNRINVLINSPGGAVREGFSIIDLIQLSPVPVWTVNIGSAMSMGLGIFLAGERRIAFPNSIFMAHAMIMTNGREEKLYDQKAFTEFAEAEQEMHAEYYASRTKRQKAWWMKLFRGQDYYFTAAEAVKLGVATDIATDFEELFGDNLAEKE